MITFDKCRDADTVIIGRAVRQFEVCGYGAARLPAYASQMGHGKTRRSSNASAGREPKACAACGREIVWRAKWERDWPSVRFCSQSCRRRGVTAVDERLEQWLREALRAGAADPEAAAIAVGGLDAAGLREPARRAARRLVASGEAKIVQSGRTGDPSTVRGPFMLHRT